MAEVVEFVDPGRSRRAGDGSSKQRKLFMSSKVSDVLKEGTSATKPLVQESDDGLNIDFESIFRRVEKLGSSQLSWKEKKKVEAERLQALGAKPVKNVKTPIAIGLGIKRKREKLEELKRQEDLAAGNFVRRTSKRKVTRNPEDRTLRVSEGKLKRGVLYVKPLASSENDRGTPRKRGFKNKSKQKKGHRR